MTNWNEDQLAKLLERRGVRSSGNEASTANPPFLPAFGSLGPANKMNKTEERYDAHLWKIRGHLTVWHAFEAITFKLAHDTRYTPDFIVQRTSGIIECHEVKGFWRDDARVKIKVAASLFPFKFLAVTAIKDGGDALKSVSDVHGHFSIRGIATMNAISIQYSRSLWVIYPSVIHTCPSYYHHEGYT